jgi:hypothetical protein
MESVLDETEMHGTKSEQHMLASNTNLTNKFTLLVWHENSFIATIMDRLSSYVSKIVDSVWLENSALIREQTATITRLTEANNSLVEGAVRLKRIIDKTQPPEVKELLKELGFMEDNLTLARLTRDNNLESITEKIDNKINTGNWYEAQLKLRQVLQSFSSVDDNELFKISQMANVGMHGGDLENEDSGGEGSPPKDRNSKETDETDETPKETGQEAVRILKLDHSDWARFSCQKGSDSRIQGKGREREDHRADEGARVGFWENKTSLRQCPNLVKEDCDTRRQSCEERRRSSETENRENKLWEFVENRIGGAIDIP